MTKAYILVDVDGVLNAFGLQGKKLPADWKQAVARSFPIIYREEMGAELLSLAAENDAELVWCTTWQETANEHIAPLVGLPELPHIPLHMPKMDASTGRCKAYSIPKWMNENGEKPFIWFDDESDCGYWLKRECPNVKAIWVQCYPSKGLRLHPEIAKADRFLRTIP